MMTIRASIAGFIALCAVHSAEANGRAGPTPGTLAAVWNSDVLATARAYLHQGNVTGFRGPWCKAFSNMVLRRAGHHPSPSLLAIDAIRDGVRVSSPEPGDLAVMRGHVTFFERWTDGGVFVGLGGNQRRDVTEAEFSRRAVVAWVRPQ